MKLWNFITLIIAVIALGIALSKTNGGSAYKAEPVYNKILASNTLRCAYTSFAPLVIVDPNTKAMSGIMYDAVNEAGKRLNIKVEWVEEVTWSTLAEGLGQRYDAFCTGLWPGANRARNTLFTNGLFWDPVGVFVRADDTRFTTDPIALNDPAYTVAYAEGDATEVMVSALLPKSKGLPLTGGPGDLFSSVISKKADASLGTRIVGVDFIEQNPGLIKEVVPAGKPFRVYPVTIGLPEGEYGLKKMLDAVIFEMQDDGTVETIAKGYLKGRSGMLYRQETGYEPL